MRALFAIGLVALVFCVPVAHAQDAPRRPPRPSPQQAPPPPPLSREDAEVVREMALLERLELVKNLELFEQDQQPPPQRQP